MFTLVRQTPKRTELNIYSVSVKPIYIIKKVTTDQQRPLVSLAIINRSTRDITLPQFSDVSFTTPILGWDTPQLGPKLNTTLTKRGDIDESETEARYHRESHVCDPESCYHRPFHARYRWESSDLQGRLLHQSG